MAGVNPARLGQEKAGKRCMAKDRHPKNAMPWPSHEEWETQRVGSNWIAFLRESALRGSKSAEPVQLKEMFWKILRFLLHLPQ